MWEHLDKFLALMEKHLGKTTAKVIKWIILISAGIAGFLWLAVFVVEHLIVLQNDLHIQLLPGQVTIPSEIFPRILFAILWTTLYFVILVGIALVIAVPLTLFTTWVFSPYTTTRIDNIFTALLPLVNKNNEVNPTNESKEVLEHTQKLYEHWNKSRFNRFIRHTTQKRTKEMWDRRKL